ncbi:hypothetical protein AXI57_00920 [Bacillus atrophaeus]|nr:hypothetical protein AXI57_00920 [Bacillus atrophaeus]
MKLIQYIVWLKFKKGCREFMIEILLLNPFLQQLHPLSPAPSQALKPYPQRSVSDKDPGGYCIYNYNPKDEPVTADCA